jgi:hypothetical protein
MRTSSRILLGLAVCASLVAGCQRTLTGPTPTFAASMPLDPNVVCNEQIDAHIVIHGDNFSPVPVNDLTSMTWLALPTVDLIRSRSLDNMPATGPDVEFQGDPLRQPQADATPMGDAGVVYQPLAGLHWTSEQQMMIDIVHMPETLPQTGLYDIQVTDRSGATATDVGQLLVVPRPTLTSVVPDFFCDADHMVSVTVNGTDFLKLSDGSQPTVTLTATGMMGATPHTYMATVVASSCHMLPGPSMTQSCTQMTISVPMANITGMLPGSEFDVAVVNPMNAHAAANCHSTDTVHLAVVPPPTIAAMGVSQTAFCDMLSMDTTVTIHGTGFIFYTDAMMHAQAPMVTIVPSSGPTLMLPAMRATGAMCNTVMGPLAAEMVQSCDAITFVIPAGSYMDGMATLSVTNPSPANCQSTTVNIRFVPRPTVTGALPTHLCAGGGTLGITGTNFVMGISAATLTDTVAPMTAVPAGSNNVVDMTHMSSMWGSGLVVGDSYTLTVSNAPGCTGTDPNPISVTLGPQIFFADPPDLYSGITTQVTLYVTGIGGAVTSVSITPSAGGASIPITNPTFDPTHPNRVEIVVPSGLADGDYDITLSDGSSCDAHLPRGLHVTSTPTIALDNVDPPFGWTNAATAVTINGANPPSGDMCPGNATPPSTTACTTGFQAGVRLYLNPASAGAGTLATPLESVTELSSSQLTAVVPHVPLPVGSYDLIAVNPDGSVGVLHNAFTVSTNAPPVVGNVAPAVVNDQAGQMGTVTGANFDTTANPMVTLRCQQPGMTAITTITSTVSNAMASSLSITYDASTLAAGSVCVVRVRNADMTYGDFSAIAITNPSANPQAPVAGPTLMTARRGAAGASAAATSAARFVYAIGGDSGTVAGAMSSVEVVPVNIYGVPQGVFTQRYALGTARTYAGSAAIGRFIYVVGGDSTSGAISSIERAYVLDPADRTSIVDLAINIVTTTGVAPGLYYYRVAPVMGATDPFNPSGENLPSEAFPVRVPMLAGTTHALTITLQWASVPGATAYNVYRTAAGGAAGTEQLIQVVSGGATTMYTDTGATAIAGMPPPIALGSTGTWNTVGAGLTTARIGPGVTALADPGDATGTLFNLYVLGGRGAANLTSIEIFPIVASASIAASDTRQTASASVASTSALTAGRWAGATYGVTHATASNVTAATPFVYFMGGHTNAPDAAGAATMTDDAFAVLPGGLLSARMMASNSTPSRGGQGFFAGGNALYSFGGAMGGPANVVDSAQITAAPPALSNWNNASITLPANLVDMGSAVLPGFGYLIGGTTGGTTAVNTLYYVNW